MFDVFLNFSTKKNVSEVEFNQDFIARVVPKIDWDCLCRAAEQLGHLEDLPKVDNGYEMPQFGYQHQIIDHYEKANRLLTITL